MTMLPSVEHLSQHLRLDDDLSPAETAELQHILDAAIDHASQYLGRPLPWLDGTADPQPVAVPPSVWSAVLLIAADLYENREMSIVGTIRTENPAVYRLLHFYRVGLGI